MDKEGPGECILGHLSMLLGIRLSHCGKYVLTADRDEKIRVSSYPKAYNIHGFCLGHTEFVSGLELSPINQSLAMTGSGDGTIRTWKYLEGREVSQKVCGEDAEIKLSVQPDSEPKLKRSELPGVRSIKCHKDKVAVTIERLVV